MGLPIPNLDDKTFDEILEEARSFISLYSDTWTDHNIHDLGITFIELFSWLTETYLYQINRITDVQYLKLLKMVNGTPYRAKPAEVVISFPDIQDTQLLPEDTQIVTLLGEEKVAFKLMRNSLLISSKIKSVKSVTGDKYTDRTEENETDGISFYPFAKKAVKGSSLWIGFGDSLPEGEICLTVDLFEDDLKVVAKAEIIPSVDLVWEYLTHKKWEPLTIKEDTTFSLYTSGYICFESPSAMDKMKGCFWIRCRISKGAYEIVPLINEVSVNSVGAIQIETLHEEKLGTGNGKPGQKFYFSKTPLIKGSQVVCIGDHVCEEKENFDLSGPKDWHYIIDSANGEILFGNGLNGRIPKEEENIVALRYETTSGDIGDIPKGQHFYIENPGLTGNLKKIVRGKDAESIENAIRRAKKERRTVHRAITAEDIETLTVETPGIRVAKAKAIPNHSTEFPCTVSPDATTVVVMPCVREDTVLPVPGEGFLKMVDNYLQSKRLITSTIYVRAPEFVETSVSCKVYLQRRSSPSEVEKRVNIALRKFLDPLKWFIGRAVYLSEIYQLIDNVDGVNYVTDVAVNAKGYTLDGDKVMLDAFAVVYSCEQQIKIKES